MSDNDNDTSNSTVGWFQSNFDQEMGETLVQQVQELIGCFECGQTTPPPTKRCSRCQLAKYCSLECQKADWKRSHKELCSIYLENKNANRDGSGGGGAPVPILLRSVGLLGDDVFESMMQQRRQLFLDLAAAASNKADDPKIQMSFSCAIVPMFDKLRLVITPSFACQSGEKETIYQVPHLVLETVDDNAETAQKWDNNPQLSSSAFQRVVEIWNGFYQQIETTGTIQPLIVTCGSGLHEEDQVDELQDALRRKGISDLNFIPNSHLILED